MDLCNHLLLVSLLDSCLVSNYCPHSSQSDSFKTKIRNHTPRSPPSAAPLSLRTGSFTAVRKDFSHISSEKSSLTSYTEWHLPVPHYLLLPFWTLFLFRVLTSTSVYAIYLLVYFINIYSPPHTRM